MCAALRFGESMSDSAMTVRTPPGFARRVTVAIRGIKSTRSSHISAMIAVHSSLILPDIKNSLVNGSPLETFHSL